jgi:hypothetical protein
MTTKQHTAGRGTEEAQAEGYNEAISDCIGLLRKWFWGTNKDARACEVDMRALAKTSAEGRDQT